MSLNTSLKTSILMIKIFFFKGGEPKLTLNSESRGYHYPQSKNIETDSTTYFVSKYINPPTTSSLGRNVYWLTIQKNLLNASISEGRGWEKRQGECRQAPGLLTYFNYFRFWKLFWKFSTKNKTFLNQTSNWDFANSWLTKVTVLKTFKCSYLWVIQLWEIVKEQYKNLVKDARNSSFFKKNKSKIYLISPK